jgi:hypothetical protein
MLLFQGLPTVIFNKMIFKLSNRGFTLTEVVISTGLAALSLSLLSALSHTGRNVGLFNHQQSTFDELVSIVRSLVGNEAACTQAFQNLPYVNAGNNILSCINVGGSTPSSTQCVAGASGIVALAGTSYGDIQIANTTPNLGLDTSQDPGIQFQGFRDINGSLINSPPLVSNFNSNANPFNPLLPAVPHPAYQTYLVNLELHAKRSNGRAPGSPALGGDLFQNLPLSITVQNNQIVACNDRVPQTITALSCFSFGGVRFDPSVAKCFFQ